MAYVKQKNRVPRTEYRKLVVRLMSINSLVMAFMIIKPVLIVYFRQFSTKKNFPQIFALDTEKSIMRFTRPITKHLKMPQAQFKCYM